TRPRPSHIPREQGSHSPRSTPGSLRQTLRHIHLRTKRASTGRPYILIPDNGITRRGLAVSLSHSRNSLTQPHRGPLHRIIQQRPTQPTQILRSGIHHQVKGRPPVLEVSGPHRRPAQHPHQTSEPAHSSKP